MNAFVLDDFHSTRSARASVIPRRQSSHLHTVVDKSEKLSAFWERISEKNEHSESIELERGRVDKNVTAFCSPELSPVSQGVISVKIHFCQID